MRPDYDRNSFPSIVRTAQSHGLEIKSGQLLTIGEREPDAKILEAEAMGFCVTVIEVFEGNVRKLKAVRPQWSILHMDCRKLCERADIVPSQFDLIWWYHGPEHMPKEDGRRLFKYLKSRARFIISSMPHGVYPQEDLYGNAHERHVSCWYEADFAEFGGIVYAETDRGDDQTSMDVFIRADA